MKFSIAILIVFVALAGLSRPVPALAQNCYNSVTFERFSFPGSKRSWLKSVSQKDLFKLPKNYDPLPRETVGGLRTTSQFGLTDTYRSLKSQCRNAYWKRVNSNWWRSNKQRELTNYFGDLARDCERKMQNTFERYTGLMCK